MIKLETADSDGNTHRVTFAFDTKIFNNSQTTAYLAPTDEDVRSGTTFSFAHQSNHISWFLDFKWINDWLAELFCELAPEADRLKIHPDDLTQDVENRAYQGHYLNILALLGEELELPRIKIASNKRDDVTKAIPVDMVFRCWQLAYLRNFDRGPRARTRRYEKTLRTGNSRYFQA